MKTWPVAILLALLAQCRQPTQTKSGEGFPPDEQQTLQEQQIEQNRARLAEERQFIESFLEKRNIEMTRTGNGLYYQIQQDTTQELPPAPTPNPGDMVTFLYTSYLLDGTMVYSADKEKPRRIKLFKEDAEMGLHEALALLGEGQEGKFVLPSHLAFGLGGDQVKIPPYSPVYYQIKVLKIEFNP